ncbi:MAG: methylmalonyl-CoA mutase family protein [Acidobacteriota bacterium]
MPDPRKFLTSSNIPLRAVYRPRDVEDIDYLADVGDPGQFPFTRGIHAEMYRTRRWTMRQYAGFGTAAETNARFHYLLAQGQTGLSVAFDLPTQMGLDSDDPQALGEVGRVGVAIDSIRDMERLLQGIPLDRISLSMTINATAPILLAMVMAIARRQGVDAKLLSGTVQNDILKEYVARGTYIYPVIPSMRLVTDVISYCTRWLPGWNPISISGYHMREAGCSAVQEIAFTFANALAYVEAALKTGLGVDDFAPRLSFFFSVHNHFLEEVAKFRAARRLWAKTMRLRYGAQDPRSLRLRFHAQTAGSTLTAQQPDVNLVRVSLQALAAVFGGAQSLHTNSRDEALGLPTEVSAQLALRTQQVIAFESGVADVADPLGGSYALEALTREIEDRSRDYLDRIEAKGGMLHAIEEGFVHREIQQAAYEHHGRLESGEEIVVGLNRFRVPEDAGIPVHCLDASVESGQIADLGQLRLQRDAVQVTQALERLDEVARGSGSLMPAILEAVEAEATVGEIAGRLRDVFGEHREAAPLV